MYHVDIYRCWIYDYGQDGNSKRFAKAKKNPKEKFNGKKVKNCGFIQIRYKKKIELDVCIIYIIYILGYTRHSMEEILTNKMMSITVSLPSWQCRKFKNDCLNCKFRKLYLFHVVNSPPWTLHIKLLRLIYVRNLLL